MTDTMLKFCQGWRFSLFHVATIVTLIAFCGFMTPSRSNATPASPNIIVFLVDDMGVMDTSVPMLTDQSGRAVMHPLNKIYRTPNMQRMANNGARFTTFYAQSVCSPSRASLMTGQNATRHRTTQWIRPSGNNRGTHGPTDWNWEGLKKGQVTLPGLLSKSGYHTIHVGKAHFGPLNHEGSDPTNLGFDQNIGGASWGRPASYYAKHHYGNLSRSSGKKGQGGTSHNVPHLEKYHDSDTYLTEALTQEAIEAISTAHKANKPFFLHMAHYAVHAPFDSDPRFANNYESLGISGKAKAFATMIEGIDKSLGDLIDTVEKLGVAGNTLIMFLGDNGSDAPLGGNHEVACAAPLRGKKGTHYEGGMRVPFIAAWARPDEKNASQLKLPIMPGHIVSHAGRIMDIFPTVLNLAGVTSPASHRHDGVDLKPLLTPTIEDYTRVDNFLMHFPHAHRSNYYTVLREGEWKLIYHYFPGTAGAEIPHELFNLKEDPYESTNLAAKNPDVLKQMVKRMIAQLEREGALYCERDGKIVKPVVPE